MPRAPEQALLGGSRHVAQHALGFLSNARSSADLTSANIDQELGTTLEADPDNGKGWLIYHSSDLGHGWTYGMQFADAKPPLKPTLRFCFYAIDSTANPVPVCALTLDQLRASLTTQKWVDRTVPSEIGSVLAIEFAKHKLLLTLRHVTSSTAPMRNAFFPYKSQTTTEQSVSTCM